MTERDIFLGLLDLPNAAARAAYLDTACGGDNGLRARVEALIRSHDAAGSFLGTPVLATPDLDPAATKAFAGAAGSDVESTRTSEGAPSPDADDETLSFLSPLRLARPNWALRGVWKYCGNVPHRLVTHL